MLSISKDSLININIPIRFCRGATYLNRPSRMAGLVLFLAFMEHRTCIAGQENIWPVSSPDAHGINSNALERLHEEFKDGLHGYIDSVLVVKSGHIVFEEYYENNYRELTRDRKHRQSKIMRDNYGELARPQYNYYDPEWHPYYKETGLHTIQSVSKSVTSALIGIAIERGDIPGVDIKIIDYFEKYKLLFQDPQKQAITLYDLLTMTAGIKWDEFSHKYTNPLNNAAAMENSDDWIKYVLSQPMEFKPGEKFVYNSGIAVLLSHILHEATNMHIDEYADKFLFEPLGIESFYWKKTPTGLVDAESGLYLSARDFAKFGYLYVNDGKWGKNQIISPEWIKSTMSPDTSIEGVKRRYGYQWWLVPYTGGSNKWVYSGSGYGGQYLLVVPEYDLTIVFNGWNIFDIPRPTIEYLSQRVLESVQ